MSQLAIRIVTALPLPGREGVVASVEVLSGEPVVGKMLHLNGHADSWTVVGFAHTSTTYHSRGLIDLLLKALGKQKSPPEGAILHTAD